LTTDKHYVKGSGQLRTARQFIMSSTRISCPAGTTENSPAIHCRERIEHQTPLSRGDKWE